ncbi:MAG: hypothetical protein FWE47_00600 [Oscillospiraceae bacterium]|nr:hypothetical protein [Oscillospiraceae bacterium]
MDEKIKIISDDRERGYVEGTYGKDLKFEARVFNEPSQFGYNHGRMSMLSIKEIDNDNEVAWYDRGSAGGATSKHMELIPEIANHLEIVIAKGKSHVAALIKKIGLPPATKNVPYNQIDRLPPDERIR